MRPMRGRYSGPEHGSMNGRAPAPKSVAREPPPRRSSHMPGRPFLQIPGPTLVPERIVRAMSRSIIDHRGPKFAKLVGEVLAGLKTVFQTERGHAIVYPGSGTGGWEAAIVNSLSPG